MGSSLGFGSTSRDCGALFRLAFAPAPRLTSLNLATERNSLAHSSIGTPSPGRNQAPTACRHTVSGTISLPSRGAFHLSLTVLVHYRSPRVFSLGGWSPQIPARFHVSRGTQERTRSLLPFAYGTLTRYGGPFQGPPAREEVSYSLPLLGSGQVRLTTPKRHGPPGREASWV